MKVKSKILLTVIPLMIMFAVIINIVFGIFFQKFILQQEEEQEHTSLNSVFTFIDERLSNGQSNVNDWGHWDDTYNFIETENNEYIVNNLVEETFENLDLSFMYILNINGDVLYKSYYSFTESKSTQFPANFDISTNSDLLLMHEDDTSSIMKIGDDYYFVNATGVTDSLFMKEMNGKLITGKLFDKAIIDSIEKITGGKFVSISVLENAKSVLDNDLPKIINKDYSSSEDLVYLKLAIPNRNQINDSVQIDLEIPRTLYVTSIKSILFFALLNTVLCIAITIIVVITLSKILSKPFELLSHEVLSINLTNEKFKKLDEVGTKEFLYIRKSINELLIKIEDKQHKITSLALYDQLTGIPNRTFFKDQLNKEISLSTRTGKLLGVIFIDLDDFKSVNDTLGHEMGDELICQVTNRLLDSIRKHDTISRFGGDEFLLILNNLTEINDLKKIADTLMTVFNKPFILNGMEYFVSCSAGISIYPIDGNDSDKLIKSADIAMYNSKNNGKNTYSFSSQILKDDLLEQIELTNNLYRALERNELEVYYQPQISIKNKKIIGFEALLRWNHPNKGQLLPAKFINIAEKTRLINPIGKWVLETVCTQLHRWNDMGFENVKIAVNMSIIQFFDPNLLHIVKTTIEESGIDPKALEIEITESIATNKSLNIEPILLSLKEIGVSIAIDDFGTEYSSLTRLKNLSIDRIKMDMQFVHSISKSDKDDAIAKIIIQLAKNLNLNIIAEGIETENQMNFLSMNACDEVQGFLYYRPMKAQEAEKLLVEQNLEQKDAI